MQQKTDLHIHTTHSSDGQHSPEEILNMAERLAFSGIAFADHMSISAVPIGIRLAASRNLRFYSGVELSTSMGLREYHLLFYGFNPDDKVLKDLLGSHCAAAWDKAGEVIIQLSELGFMISREDVDGWGSSIPTGVTFLNALKKRNSSDGRLREYLYGSKSSSPYLNFYQDFSITDIGNLLLSGLPDLKDTMGLLRGRGVLILAHPGAIEREVLLELKSHGLDGIEAYSSHHKEEITGKLVKTARSLGLLISAGSDFHGELIKPDIPFGTVFGDPDQELIRMLDSMQKA
jgi:3',5'-nucleoside bisphosphate phosphatase